MIDFNKYQNSLQKNKWEITNIFVRNKHGILKSRSAVPGRAMAWAVTILSSLPSKGLFFCSLLFFFFLWRNSCVGIWGLLSDSKSKATQSGAQPRLSRKLLQQLPAPHAVISGNLYRVVSGLGNEFNSPEYLFFPRTNSPAKTLTEIQFRPGSFSKSYNREMSYVSQCRED